VSKLSVCAGSNEDEERFLQTLRDAGVDVIEISLFSGPCPTDLATIESALRMWSEALRGSNPYGEETAGINATGSEETSRAAVAD
jgi:hypothetical protein